MSIADRLNQPSPQNRLSALRAADFSALPAASDVYVNNHIHTIYSFSPYSPTLALYKARSAGLPTAGIMDHDSVAGAMEFIEAGEILNVATTVGLECRTSFEHTPFAKERLNNPDQVGNVYLAMHGIPSLSFPLIEAFLAPLRKVRSQRNRHMTERLNDALAPVQLSLSYQVDIVPLSMWIHGGSVTERHICYAASKALLEKYGAGRNLFRALTKLGITPSEKIATALADETNPFLDYDLLGLLKSNLVSSFYLPATDDECPPVEDFVALCKEAGAIAAYPYLGDVGASVTGDKKSQAFEDGFLDALFAFLHTTGFDAITYMPSRNTQKQIARLQALCDQYQFFQISGEDINSPSQSFICPALAQAEFSHLRTATWALIGHEIAATKDIKKGMFTPWAKKKHPDLQERIAYYANIGLSK